jgi:hypothetical protein
VPHIARETMERNISECSRRLLTMAQELDCHVLLLSQLNQQGFAKWSGQSNDDAHFNWSVVSCGPEGAPAADGTHLLFKVSQRFGHSGIVPRVYLRDGETGQVSETCVCPRKVEEDHEQYANQYQR